MEKGKLKMKVNYLFIYPLLLTIVFSIQGCTDPSTQLFDLYEQSEAFEEEMRDQEEDQLQERTPDELEEDYRFWSDIHEQLQQIDRDGRSMQQNFL